MEKKYNTRSPAVKRLMREAAEMSNPTSEYFAAPLEDNLFEWHFTVRGPEDTDFQGGIYHGRIIVPAEYPMKPPDIIFLTPNGRFEVGKKICLSITGYHQETWQPSWSIRTALLAIIGFMPSPGQGTIGSLDYTPEERRALAVKSRDWTDPVRGKVANLLLPPGASARSEQEQQEMDNIVQTVAFKSEEQMKKEKESSKSEKSEAKDNKEEAAKNDSESQQPLHASSSSSKSNSESTQDSKKSGISSTSNTRTTPQSQSRVQRSQVQAVTEPSAEGGGYVMYDVLIMVLVAAIATLLYRRINLMGADTE